MNEPLEEELVKIDDLVETVDAEAVDLIVAETAAKNALVVYVLQPPAELGEREAEIWREVMNGVVPGHLSDKDIPALSNYCRLLAEIEFCDKQIEKIKSYYNFDPLDKTYYDAYKTWSKQRSAAFALSLRLATSMRLTNQAFRQDNKSVNTITQKGELWNFDGDNSEE